MITEKICKGTGKANGYGCGNLVAVSIYNRANRIYGLGKSCGCYSKWLLNSEAGQEKLNKSIFNATAQRKDLNKLILDKKSETSLNKLLLRVRDYCHEYIRLRDKGKPCISCSANWNTDFQAGHFYKAETYTSIRFDVDNVNGQCRKCNLRLDGNFNGYEHGISERFGLNHLEMIRQKALKDHHNNDNHKWERGKLIEIREDFKIKIKNFN